GGDIKLNGTSLDNKDIVLKELKIIIHTHREERWHKNDGGHTRPDCEQHLLSDAVEIGRIPSLIQAGGRMTGTLAGGLKNDSEDSGGGKGYRGSGNYIPELKDGKSSQVIAGLTTIEQPDIQLYAKQNLEDDQFEQLIKSEYSAYFNTTNGVD